MPRRRFLCRRAAARATLGRPKKRTPPCRSATAAAPTPCCCTRRLRPRQGGRRRWRHMQRAVRGRRARARAPHTSCQTSFEYAPATSPPNTVIVDWSALLIATCPVRGGGAAPSGCTSVHAPAPARGWMRRRLRTSHERDACGSSACERAPWSNAHTSFSSVPSAAVPANSTYLPPSSATVWPTRGDGAEPSPSLSTVQRPVPARPNPLLLTNTPTAYEQAADPRFLALPPHTGGHSRTTSRRGARLCSARTRHTGRRQPHVRLQQERICRHRMRLPQRPTAEPEWPPQRLSMRPS